MQDIADVVMPLSIALIMFGIGLELCFNDFRRVIFRPRGILTGLAAQLFLLPVVAFLIAIIWPMEDMHKIGIMLLAACPGGTASNLVTKILKGRVALSVSLTAFNSFIVLFSIPLIMEFSFMIFGGNGETIELSFTQTMKDVFLTVLVPVFAGILLNEFFGKYFGSQLSRALKYILPFIMLIAFVVVIFFDESQRELKYFEHLNLLIPLVVLNVATMLIGYFSSRKLRLKHNTSYTIAIEMGLQNSVLALFIANQILDDKDLSLVAILYSSFSLISTFLIAWGMQNYFKPKEKNL